MSRFLAGLGQALLRGGELGSQWRAEDLAADRERRMAEQQKLQMALEQRRFDMENERFTLAQEDRKRNIARETLTDAGPSGNLSPEAVEQVTSAGLGHRIRPAVEVDPVTFSPIEGGQAYVLPTAREQMELDQQNIQKRAQAALGDERFWQLPPERRAVVWQQAGLGGAPPQSVQEVKDLMRYQSDLQMRAVNAQTAATVEAAAQRAARGAAGGLTPNQALTQTRMLQKQYQAETKTSQELVRQYGLMQSGLEAAARGNMAAGSQAVLVTFQKILDPNSVVRESEYARSGEGLALLDQIKGRYERLVQGGAGVPLSELQQFAALAGQFMESAVQSAAIAKRRIDATADAFGLDKTLITADFGDAPPALGANPTAPASPAPARKKFTIVGQ